MAGSQLPTANNVLPSEHSDISRDQHPLIQVLLVDDNQDDNLYHTLVLKESDPEIEVISVSSSDDALAFLAALVAGVRRPPDLVLLDLNMPAMTGWEFIEAYEQRDGPRHIETQLFVLSTTENPDDIERAELDPRVAGFLSKPLNEAKLAELVSAFF